MRAVFGLFGDFLRAFKVLLGGCLEAARCFFVASLLLLCSSRIAQGLLRGCPRVVRVLHRGCPGDTRGLICG